MRLHRAFYPKPRRNATLIAAVLSLWLTSFAGQSLAALPSLGNGYSTTASDEEQLGEAWFRIIQGQSKRMSDPVVTSYVEDLTQKLSSVSELTNTEIRLTLIDDQMFNGFAIPGRVMGLNSGLLLAAQSEGELASVIAHELAHLSQRHYAQQVAQQKQSTPYLIAATIGSLILASQNADAGAAALTSTFAGNAQASITFTRENEKEADAIGIQTLERAGYSGAEMAAMFGRLAQLSRFQDQGLEFLRTHPLTDSRIAAAQSRIKAQPLSHAAFSMDFEIAKARIESKYTKAPKALISALQAELQTPSRPQHLQEASLYGLVYTLMNQNYLTQARNQLSKANPSFKNSIHGMLLDAELLYKEQAYSQAFEAASVVTDIIPRHYAANILAARSLEKIGNYTEAANTLEELARYRPEDTNLWFQLAEIYGLSKNTEALHLSRIKYFIYTGQPKRAFRQIKFARQALSITEGSNSPPANSLIKLEKQAKALDQAIKAATS